MKMANKKRVAKIAIEQEEMQQQQQQQNENTISLLNQNELENSSSLMKELIDYLMNDDVGADNDGFMRELSNSPLNLTEANSERDCLVEQPQHQSGIPEQQQQQLVVDSYMDDSILQNTLGLNSTWIMDSADRQQSAAWASAADVGTGGHHDDIQVMDMSIIDSLDKIQTSSSGNFEEMLPEAIQPDDVGNDYQLQILDPVGDLEAACFDESAQEDVIHQASIAFLSAGHEESQSSEVQFEGIRINKPKDSMLTAIHLATPSIKLKCSMCYKSFATKERLEKHMIVHSAEETKPLECHFCPKRFMTNSVLAGHVKTHAEQGFECPMCTFVTQHCVQLKEHVQSHKNKDTAMFHCPKCTKRFAAYSMVRKHIRAFHSPRRFGCTECTKDFQTAEKLERHRLKHSDHREFLCAECGRQFKRKDKLREHHKRKHENKPPTLPKTASQEFEKFVYKCVECMMGFKRRGMLVNHLAKRHPDKPREQVPELNMQILRPTGNYSCPYCDDRVYKSRCKRKSHILKSHPDEPLPPQLKGKDSLTVKDGEKIITVSVNSVLSSLNESILSARAAAGKSKDSKAAAILQSTSSMVSTDPNKKQLIETTTSDQPKIFNAQPLREMSVVGKEVMANPHACKWCHRQYATGAKLLQHQRKSHIQLMPPDMQQPRTRKNNVFRNKDQEMFLEQLAENEA